jgi:hypothetical protein
MMPLHDYLVGLATTAANIVSICGALWLAFSLLNYADKNRKQL